jgi:hypothetical protein
MSKAIYKLHFDCGRQGTLDGLFIAEKDHVQTLMQKKVPVYFGEVLGKHSEVYGPIESEDITFVSDNSEAIGIIEEFQLENGHNPFEYTTTQLEEDWFEDDMTTLEVVQKYIEHANDPKP